VVFLHGFRSRWLQAALGLAGALLLASAPAMAAGSNLVVNGSFESPSVPATAGNPYVEFFGSSAGSVGQR
jgi:hypothetical protein